MMSYHKKLVATIKANGKILREFNDTVYVPYGSEYSIFLKNLNTVRALINITIDGTDVIPGGLVMFANTELNLERFVTNHTTGNRFKFIERTPNIEQHRGIKADDGLIRIEFQFEKVYANTWIANTTQVSDTWKIPRTDPYWFDVQNINNIDGVKLKCTRSVNAVYNATSATTNSSDVKTSVTDNSEIGITVPGSISNQSFTTASWFPLEIEKHVIVFRLLGETAENKIVREPVHVKVKQKCITCGRVNKATNKFCSECGTSLELVA